jgi:hypothetical protein
MKQFVRDDNVRDFLNRHARLIGFLVCLVIFAGIVGWAAKRSPTQWCAPVTPRHWASIRRACEATNARHDAAIRKLDALIHELPPHKRTRAIQQRAGTVSLIEALAPHQNCAVAVRTAVGS